MSYYGQKPKKIGSIKVNCKEMMFYQYLPIKLAGQRFIKHESRLDCFEKLITKCCRNFIGIHGAENYEAHNVYLTAKHMYQGDGKSFNRPGYHSDGFLTDDINYIWCDRNPTIFNISRFDLTPDDKISLSEMEDQAKPENEMCYKVNTILRLDQFNIHKVAEATTPGMRTFVKVSFSKDRYDLVGNSHNYELNYKWKLKSRSIERNIPQSKMHL